jgi:hypothetical protein
VAADYSANYDDIVYNAEMNYRQMEGIKTVLVGFGKTHDNKYIMYVRGDGKYIMLRQKSDYTNYMAAIGYIEYNSTNKIKFVEEKTQDWQGTYNKQINAGSDTPTWTYSSNLTQNNTGTNHIWTKNAMVSMTAKDLNDESVQRFLHVHIGDNAVMLVLERKNVSQTPEKSHFFCFGKYTTTMVNKTTIEGVMVYQAVSGLFKIY